MYYTEFYKTTWRHVKTTPLYLYLEQELHSDEIFHKASVPLCNVLVMEIESTATAINKRYISYRLINF